VILREGWGNENLWATLASCYYALGGSWDDWFDHKRLLPHPFRGFIAERVGVEEIVGRIGFPPFAR